MRGRSGSALIMALFIMVLLVALAAAAASLVRLRVRDAREGVADLQRLYLAQAAVRMAEATLRLDDANVDSLDEEWALLGNTAQDQFPMGEGENGAIGWYRVQIIDTASRVNINTASKELLLRLPGVEDSLADAIMDWREVGEEARPAGAKADYYQALPTPYLPREAAFETVGELLLVRDVTPVLLYGPPSATGTGEEVETTQPLSERITVFSQERNVNASGNARINLNTATADQLEEAAVGGLTEAQAEAIVDFRSREGEFRSLGQLFDVPGINEGQVRALVDNVALTGATMVPGRININTASQETLAMIPGITPEAAESIVTRREENAFTSIGELLEEDLLDTNAFQQAVDFLCTRSSAFLVRAMGRVANVPGVTAVEALVERTAEGTRIVRWARVERAPGWIAWAWPRHVSDTENGGVVAW